MTNPSNLTPYDTGAILEPKLHRGFTGKVDFENDSSESQLTVHATPSDVENYDGISVDIDTLGPDHITIVVDGNDVLSEPLSSLVAREGEPSLAQYAALGRYVAALIGSQDQMRSSADAISAIANRAEILRSKDSPFPEMNSQSLSTATLWRRIAEELDISHDGSICVECREWILIFDVRAEGDLCGSCAHNARRSG